MICLMLFPLCFRASTPCTIVTHFHFHVLCALGAMCLGFSMQLGQCKCVEVVAPRGLCVLVLIATCWLVAAVVGAQSCVL